MNIEKLMQDALVNQTPVRLRDGRKAFVVTDARAMAKKLGLNGYDGSRRDYEVMTIDDEKCLFVFTVWASGQQWTDGERSMDVVGVWVEFPHWDAIAQEYKYVAMDIDGHWYAYHNKPVFGHTGWGVARGSSFASLAVLAGLPDLPGIMAKHILIERPD